MNEKKQKITENELLPIHLVKKELVEAIKNNDSLVIVGETGSGKYVKKLITQFYNFLLERKTLILIFKSNKNPIKTEPKYHNLSIMI